jgi:hypothetical protein
MSDCEALRPPCMIGGCGQRVSVYCGYYGPCSDGSISLPVARKHLIPCGNDLLCLLVCQILLRNAMAEPLPRGLSISLFWLYCVYACVDGHASSSLGVRTLSSQVRKSYLSTQEVVVWTVGLYTTRAILVANVLPVLRLYKVYFSNTAKAAAKISRMCTRDVRAATPGLFPRLRRYPHRCRYAHDGKFHEERGRQSESKPPLSEIRWALGNLPKWRH